MLRYGPSRLLRSYAGWMRVLVTRAEGQAAGLVEALEARGAEAVVIPAIAIAPLEEYGVLDAAIARMEAFRWVVFTSVNGVECFHARGGAVPDGVRVAVIGKATARAAVAAGMRVNLVPERSVAEGLVEALVPLLRAGDAVLVVRAQEGRDVLPEALAEAGAELVLAPADRDVGPKESVAAVQALFAGAGVDAVTFASSSSVRNLRELLVAAGVTLPETVRRVSIGPITSATMRELGWDPDAEAMEASVEALAEACSG